MNLKIKRISDYLHENKDTYFTVYFGDSFAIKDSLFEPLTDKNKGKKRFNEIIDKVLEYEPDYLLIKIYRKAKVKFKKTPEMEEKIFLKKQQTNEKVVGLGAMEAMEERVQTRTDIAILNKENETLKENLSGLKSELSDKKKEAKKYEITNKELVEKNREHVWDIKELKRQHSIEIQNINRQNDRFEQILEIGGRIAMEKAEQSGVDISGFLGSLGSPQPQGNLPEKNNAEVEFTATSDESNSDESKEKKQARVIATQIFENINIIIDKNEDKEVVGILNKIVNIYNYITRNTENLNEIYELIYTESETK